MNPEMPLKPGAVIGILGGGQLGRMLALAAARLGLRCHIYAPKGDNPAFEVAHQATEAAYEDGVALAAFARSVAVATYEFENMPVDAARAVAALVPLAPGAKVLEVTQDRVLGEELRARLRPRGARLPAGVIRRRARPRARERSADRRS